MRPDLPSHLTLFLLLAALLGSPMVEAETKIYKKVLPDGTVIFTDEPVKGAVEVELPPPQTVPALRLPPQPPAATERKQPPRFRPYTQLAIVSPGNDQALRANDGRMEVRVALQPPLQSRLGHRLVLKLDGQVVAVSTGNPSFVLENVDRGTHRLVVEVQDGDQHILKRSEPVTFHLLRRSVLLGPKP